MPSFQSFRGRQYFAPSVIIDVRNELVAPPPLGKSIAIFGEFPQLKKGEVYTFTQSSAGDLERQYRNVVKMRNAGKLWSNSIRDFNGQANALSFINVAPSAQAEIDVNDKDDVGVAATFKSRLYGLDGNRVSFRLETPDSTTTSPAGIGLDETQDYYRIRFFAPGDNNEYKFGYPSVCKITYQDSDASPDQQSDCNITIAAGVMTITITGDDAKVETLTLGDYGSWDDFKNDFELIDDRLSITPRTFSVLPSKLDECDVDFVDDANAPVTNSFHAHTYALEEGLASIVSPIELELTDGRYRLLKPNAGDSAAEPLPASSKYACVGGTQSSASEADYAEVFALSAILTKDFTTCVVESTSAGVHRLLEAYLDESEIRQKERNGWAPAPEDSTIDSIYGLYVLPVNNKRVSIVGQGITYDDYKNVRRVGNTYDCAVLFAAMQGAVSAGTPLTGSVPNISDTSEVWDREFDIDELVQKGIVGISLNVNNELSVVRSITSYMTDNLLQNIEVSSRESIDASVRDLRRFLTSELGTVIRASTKDKLKTLVEQRLTLHRDTGIIFGFKNVSVRVENDVAYIEYDVALSNALNFIRVTANIVSSSQI